MGSAFSSKKTGPAKTNPALPKEDAQKEKMAPTSDQNPQTLPKQDAKKTQEPSTKDAGQIVSSDESHVQWRSYNMAAVLEQHPNDPWWDVAKILCPSEDTVITPDTKRRGWKTVRLFVSSTFRDMHSEREYLIKKIFPRLREWCRERKLRMVECDLRWGVPKDADARQTILTCLSEIDRCYEANAYPYFLAMLSERYGWVPEPHEVPPDIKHRYKWIPGMSVTSLEIFTGNCWAGNPNALCMLRSPDFLSEIQSSTVKSSYVETDQTAKESLVNLKELLRNINGGNVFNYTSKVESEQERRAVLIGLEKFGEQVLDHFQKAVAHQYPPITVGSELTNQELQHTQHEAFMTQRSSLLLGRDEVLDDVRRYIHEKTTSSRPLVVIGYPGAGKSAVIASVAKELVSKGMFTVFYHFVGATPGSTTLPQMLTRLWQELMQPTDKVPVDYNELKRSLVMVVGKSGLAAEAAGKHGVVILLDALNQLDVADDVHTLTWLPRKLPGNVRIIVSTLEGPCLDALRQGELKLPEVLVGPLREDARRQIAQQVLSEYNKVLDEEQLQTLVEKSDAGRPLYLTVACEELRVFGEFRKLTQKVTDLASDMTGLLAQVLERICVDNGGDIVVATLCLIESSRFGLLETELIDMLGITTRLPQHGDADVPETRDPLPMAEWAYVFVGLRQFLRPAGSSGEGRLDFYHRTISKVVRTQYLNSNQNTIWWHRRLANYFMETSDAERRAEELPYQLRKLDDKERLESVLLEEPMFNELYTPDNLQELMTYWEYLGGYDKAAPLYMDRLNPDLQVDISSLEPVLARKTKLARFMTDIGQYVQAESLFIEVIECTTKKFGEDAALLCKPLAAIVEMFYFRALTVVYSSHPLYGHCKTRGTHYGKLCAEVHKRHLSADDVTLGRVLTKCGYFIHSLLDDALVICRERSLQDYAEILYMMGEKKQYDRNIGVPEKLFKESYDLCRTHFGPVHLKTARCNQLWGQLYWNQHTSYKSHRPWMERCLELYSQEVSILEDIQGKDHPNTVRSREDVIIILQTLGRNAEAEALLAQQPADAAAT